MTTIAALRARLGAVLVVALLAASAGCTTLVDLGRPTRAGAS